MGLRNCHNGSDGLYIVHRTNYFRLGTIQLRLESLARFGTRRVLLLLGTDYDPRNNHLGLLRHWVCLKFFRHN
ncbi:hypothetical protein PsorP6_019456 [Peronosclerospora sorghi]|nr:hypothetical protein PsorP6_019456 [Peronosclerospora sorghi]